jgi:thiamine biosynthesis protein ThiI
VARLVRNLRRALQDVDGDARALGARVAVTVPDEVPWARVKERVAMVCGVANFSPSYRAPLDLEAVKSELVARLRDVGPGTFRVAARRSWKGFPRTSMEIEREVGGALKLATGRTVDLEDPQLTVFVEVLDDRILYSFEKVPGPGGFPVGTAGRVMALLSGGIDSPVAAWRMMRRGCKVIAVHFHAFPLLDHTTIDKARDLARALTRWQYSTRLLLVPFGAAQQTIVASCPAPLRVVLYRRFMVRIAEALSARQGAKALVTGESLGQVASQTLDNMAVIDAAARGPVLRPLVGMDKEEITAQARRIGTFEISTLPDQDCCQLFVPKSPATAARLDDVLRAEEALDTAALVRQAVHETATERFAWP